MACTMVQVWHMMEYLSDTLIFMVTGVIIANTARAPGRAW